jgi:hypothetical protein
MAWYIEEVGYKGPSRFRYHYERPKSDRAVTSKSDEEVTAYFKVVAQRKTEFVGFLFCVDSDNNGQFFNKHVLLGNAVPDDSGFVMFTFTAGPKRSIFCLRAKHATICIVNKTENKKKDHGSRHTPNREARDAILESRSEMFEKLNTIVGSNALKQTYVSGDFAKRDTSCRLVLVLFDGHHPMIPKESNDDFKSTTKPPIALPEDTEIRTSANTVTVFPTYEEMKTKFDELRLASNAACATRGCEREAVGIETSADNLAKLSVDDDDLEHFVDLLANADNVGTPPYDGAAIASAGGEELNFDTICPVSKMNLNYATSESEDIEMDAGTMEGNKPGSDSEHFTGAECSYANVGHANVGVDHSEFSAYNCSTADTYVLEDIDDMMTDSDIEDFVRVAEAVKLEQSVKAAVQEPSVMGEKITAAPSAPWLQRWNAQAEDTTQGNGSMLGLLMDADAE